VEPAQVNCQPALIGCVGEKVFAVLTIEAEAQQIRTFRSMANPEKFAQV
jgi:hypothetical protein